MMSPTAPILSQNTLPQAPDKQPRNPSLDHNRLLPIYSRLLTMLGIFAAFTGSFYLIVYLRTGINQSLWAAVPIMITVTFIPFVYRLARQDAAIQAGVMTLFGVSIAYWVNELLWVGLTPFHIVGGILLILLTGHLILQRERWVWLSAIGIYIVFIILANTIHPLPRYNVAELPVLLPYAIGTNILLVLALTALVIRSIRTRTIRTRLLVNFILLILAPVILSAAISSILSAQNAKEHVFNQAERYQSEALTFIYQTLGINLGVVTLAALVALGAGWYAARGITDPLSKLTKTAEAIAAGDLTKSAEIGQDDEVDALAKSFNSMADQLRFRSHGLEQRVSERTLEVERRSLQLQVAAEVAREVTATRDLSELLNRAVNLVKEHFSYYHVGIFLIDERNEYAILRAATGDAGQQMLLDGHKLEVSKREYQGGQRTLEHQGLVSYVCGSGVARIVSDVESDPFHFKNPLLPDTRSEVALPLRVGNQLIGVLDTQSTDEGTFTDENVRILQTMADLLAIAIENARLFQEMSQAVRELETVYGQYTRKAWIGLKNRGQEVREESVSDYRYSGLAIETAEKPNAEAYEALKAGHTVVKVEQPHSALAIPLRLRGQTVGVVNLRFEGQTLPMEEVSTYEEIANRLVLVLENARLLQEAQQLARREQQINVISTKIRGSSNTDSILRNTVRELGNALGASRTFIQLGIQVNEPGKDKHELNTLQGQPGILQSPTDQETVKTTGDDKEPRE